MDQQAINERLMSARRTLTEAESIAYVWDDQDRGWIEKVAKGLKQAFAAWKGKIKVRAAGKLKGLPSTAKGWVVYIDDKSLSAKGASYKMQDWVPTHFPEALD